MLKQRQNVETYYEVLVKWDLSKCVFVGIS